MFDGGGKETPPLKGGGVPHAGEAGDRTHKMVKEKKQGRCHSVGSRKKAWPQKEIRPGQRGGVTKLDEHWGEGNGGGMKSDSA